MSFFCATALFAQSTFEFGTNANPDGVKIEVDSHGLIVGGKHILPVMGEIHYCRVPQNEWRREIRKMRAGGINIVATYVFWIHHEEEEGIWNWSGNRDLRRFIQTCKEENMPVVLRIGPFCHGEVYQGGFPKWLVEKSQGNKEYKLRSEGKGFIEETHKLYSNIFAQVSGLMWKDGGPIIGVQIENECRGPWSYYMKLKDMAVKIGFDVPFMTRTGWPKLNGKEEFGKLLPLYGDYADGFWDRKLTDMPGEYPKAFIMKDTRLSGAIATETFGTNQDTKMEASSLKYPYLTCELGGGMMPSYHRRINISGNEAFPLAICKLGSGSNLPGYYMYHGGTNPYNPKHTMAECQASAVTNYNDMPHMSYDFQAPLGEMGQPNINAYHQTRWLHQFLADWGEELSQMDVDSLSEHYARRGCFEFRNTYVRINNEQGVASVTPNGMMWNGLSISSSTVQPFAKTESTLYFIGVKGAKKSFLTIGKKKHTLKADKPITIGGKELVVLSEEKAKSAFVIDGKMHYAKNGGILYKTQDGIVEECWKNIGTIEASKQKEHGGLREVKLGTQKVAEQPYETDFDKAAVWSIDCNSLKDAENKNDLFLKISYKGDCARIYADGQLVEDNFWNGKPMYVRVSDIAGKRIELKILPLGKNYPVYLQEAQKKELEAATDGLLLSLDGIELIERSTALLK